MRLARKLGIGVAAAALILIVLWLLKLSLEAKRLDVGWSRRLPIDRPLGVVDDPAVSAIAGSVDHRFVALYKGATGELLWRYAIDLFAKGHVVDDVAISANGGTLAAARRGGEIVIFDRFANRKGSLKATAPVQALALSGDGRRLAQIAEDGRIFISDLSGGNGNNLELGPRPLKISLNRLGDRLLIATSRRLEVRSVDGRKIWSRPVRVRKLSVAADNKISAVATVAGNLRVYNKSGRLRWTYNPDRSMPRFTSVAVSGSGRYIGAAGNDRLYLFTGAGKLINIYKIATKGAGTLAFAGGERVLVSAGQEVLSGLLIGEALNRAAAMRRAVRWAWPALIFILALMLFNIFTMRQLSRPAAVGEVVDFPEKVGKKGRRKAA